LDPIIVVGAGPTGLAAALALGLQGVRVIVLEAEPSLTHDLRAGSFHPPTLEMLQTVGVADSMHELGIIVPTWQIRDRLEGIVAEFELSLLRDETPYPYRLHLEQHRLTPLLLDRIGSKAPDVSVRFSAAVVGFEQDAAGVRVALADGETIRASFLLGADGARSVVRRTMGVAFEGFTWEDRFLVASTRYDLGQHGFARAGYIADPDKWAAVFNVPDTGPPGLWRVCYPIQPDEDEKVALSPENIQESLRTILGPAARPCGGVFDLAYSSVYRVHQRVAARFVSGRVALMGDAAHLNNPLGGLGLNGSVHDAFNLAEKLRGIWHEGADHEELFDLYDRQRRPINTKAIQSMSIRNKRLLEERDPATRVAGLGELRAVANDPVKAKEFLMDTSMIASVREAAAVR
jgi:3-(3-hydroxy-phenyl)propionate hydroxylase